MFSKIKVSPVEHKKEQPEIKDATILDAKKPEDIKPRGKNRV